MMSLGAAITQVTIAQGETRTFTVRVPEEGVPQYVYDDDPDNPVDVPQDIVDEAKGKVVADGV